MNSDDDWWVFKWLDYVICDNDFRFDNYYQFNNLMYFYTNVM